PRSTAYSLQPAFTLIEVLVAMTVLAVMVLMAANIFQSSSASWNIGTQKADMNTSARAALDFMARELETLLALRNADLEILALEKHLHALRADIHERQEAIARLRESITASETAVMGHESRRRLRELEAAKFSGEVGDLQRQLKEAHNNKEFAAFNTQIRARSQAQKAVEDLVLECLEAIEAEQLRRTGYEAAIVEAQTACAGLEEKISTQVAEAEAAIATQRRERDALAGKLPRELAAEYTRLFERFAGEAVCALEEGTCTGCWMTLASGDVGRLIREPVILCPSCGRLLHRAG
ncbi:MAG: prepilin-type N-terminal cleavage/methylation domain-containing protein, partial [Dehalococcoidia bacterium]|nr:prepilin-type N-terminal cleavage/methylation domain-containing protein [Dehalococcoidia bacterium]